ncbi:9813_t:CDS:2 [Gigaspora rosea]|nr:9813_t:CDS:2 [Gigaspora rosea]
MSASTNTSYGENAFTSTIDLLKKCTKTEQMIAFLDEQDLGLKEHHFGIFRDQEMDGPAERIVEFIEKIKGEGQEYVKFNGNLPKKDIEPYEWSDHHLVQREQILEYLNKHLGPKLPIDVIILDVANNKDLLNIRYI